MSKKLLLSMALVLAFNANAATKLQKKMSTFIDSLASIYTAMYAPALWKKEFANWTMEAELAKAKDKILEKELSISEFHKVVNTLILSMKDYHVSVSFYATEKASLPFTIRGSQGRYFFVYIDRDKLSKSHFPFELGDELISMEGEKVANIVAKLKANLGQNTEETDQALAEMMVTSRSAARAQTVPQGTVTLVGRKKDGSETSIQLIWDYKKEEISYNIDDEKSFDDETISFNAQMTTQISEDFAREAKAENLFALGGKKSYLPTLGTKIWSSDKDSHFDAYIYLNNKKELVGYVRIPKYGAGEKESLQFKEIIKKFAATTDKLVIDQLNNPGGSVFYLYSLVSMLTNKPMATPKHYMSINQSDIMSAIKSLSSLRKITNLEEAQKAMGGKTVSGYPVSMNFVEFTKAYYQFLIDEWNQGKTLTAPYHLYGVDKINPHPEIQYTKPILLLINELDFSGGDFFPSIMQDNKRATIMGVRTAGAGGYVIAVDIPNQLGVGGFRYTGSLADRVDHTPIENLGVTPEIEYSLTPEDFQNNFNGFKTKVNEVLDTL